MEEQAKQVQPTGTIIDSVEKLHWTDQDILIVKTQSLAPAQFVEFVQQRLMSRKPCPRMVVFMRVGESIDMISRERAIELLNKIVATK